MKNSRLLFHPIFLISLSLLLLNDFLFKFQFHNALTGKLSDFTGLIVLSFFLAVLFPRFKHYSTFITGLLFLLWKTPLVNPFISTFNSLTLFEIARVIDYSDLWALLVLPFAHYLLCKKRIEIPSTLLWKSASYIVGLCTFFAITATSRASHFCIDPTPEASVYLGKTYKVKGTPEQVLGKIRGIVSVNEKIDSSICFYYAINYKQTGPFTVMYPYENIYSMETVDTIQFLNFNIYAVSNRKSEIEFINIGLANWQAEQNWKDLKQKAKNYEYCLKLKLIKPLKEKQK